MWHQVGASLGTFTKDHIWNFQFSIDQQLPFFKLRLNYPIWQHHYGGDYYMLSRRFGLFILPIVDNDWSTPQGAAQRIDFWQSTIPLLKSPHSSVTPLQINLKAEPDSSSHHTPYKQKLFLQKALLVLYRGFKACISLQMSHSLEGTQWGFDAGEMY